MSILHMSEGRFLVHNMTGSVMSRIRGQFYINKQVVALVTKYHKIYHLKEMFYSKSVLQILSLLKYAK